MTGPEPRVYHLTADEAERDDEHRAHCRDSLCGDPAHSYVKAIYQNRVFVHGVPFLDWEPRRWKAPDHEGKCCPDA